MVYIKAGLQFLPQSMNCFRHTQFCIEYPGVFVLVQDTELQIFQSALSGPFTGGMQKHCANALSANPFIHRKIGDIRKTSGLYTGIKWRGLGLDQQKTDHF